MRHEVSGQAWDSFSCGDKAKLCKEIAFFEDRLMEVGYPGTDLYKKAVVNAFKGLIHVNKQQLLRIS